MSNKLAIFIFIFLTISAKATCFPMETTGGKKDIYVAQGDAYRSESQGFSERGRTDTEQLNHLDNAKMTPKPATLLLLSSLGLFLFYSRKFRCTSFFSR